MDDADRSHDEPSDHGESTPSAGSGDDDDGSRPEETDDLQDGGESEDAVAGSDGDAPEVEGPEEHDWYGSKDAHDPGWYEMGADEKPTDGSDDTDDADDEEADADASESVSDGGTATVDDDITGIEGPETDEEMPLAAHIEEMMRRLAVVFLLGGLATLVVVTESTTLINYFWDYHIPAPLENRPRLYAPLELPLTRLKVAGIAGVVVGLPAFVYQTYRFMKPGLYENERRYYLAAVPTSLVLGGLGVAFAHFLVLPAIFSYFTTYTSDAATIAFGLAETFNLIVIMLAFMAIVFQIPLFIMLAIMMNLVTRVWLEDKRLIFWGAFLGIAFLFSPDPTGMAPIIVTLTMIVLFEGTLAILRWTGN